MTQRCDVHELYPPPERVNFDVCPICLCGDPTTDEHVPPRAIGGLAMTVTCTRCNNDLGSLVDRPFVDSMYGRFRRFSISTEASNGVRGFRRLNNVRLAAGNGIEQALFVDGAANGPLLPTLRGTNFEAKGQLPDPGAVLLGELKNLYLACCVVAGDILSGDSAERLRATLVAARDSRAVPDPGELTVGAQYVRHIQPFEADVKKPPALPLRQMIVARDGDLFPAVGWQNYICESPFADSPEISAQLAAGLQFFVGRQG